MRFTKSGGRLFSAISSKATRRNNLEYIGGLRRGNSSPFFFSVALFLGDSVLFVLPRSIPTSQVWQYFSLSSHISRALRSQIIRCKEGSGMRYILSNSLFSKIDVILPLGFVQNPKPYFLWNWLALKQMVPAFVLFIYITSFLFYFPLNPHLHQNELRAHGSRNPHPLPAI